MKICPNCHFENFENVEYCDGCGDSLTNIRSEFFTIVDFIRKNSAIYAVIAIFLGLFEYFFSSLDSNVKIISLFPLFVSIYLLFSLIFKGYHIVNSQHWENSFDRYFNVNAFELWIFLSINVSLILGLLWITGIQFILAISMLGLIVISLVVFIRRISNIREMTTHTLWFNLIGALFLEIGWLILQLELPILRTISDPTLWFWTFMIPIFLLFFGIGAFLANIFIGGWIFITGSQQNQENPTYYSWQTLRQDFDQYIQIFNEKLSMQITLGLIILLGILIGCISL